ncbi:energy transducer TonB [Methylocella tundrae]|uniref:TonB family protein n=1 Tax=Methylocella tundrae TaxID=227605 RepID=A0A4U8YZC1_METTU|nr:energy transducer TonB [Methylocella tundrae]WPP04837.1 energy transducer TonB [Methylocella tundrae]VFU07083.1 TonB family protein [Methylocella tundrae]
MLHKLAGGDHGSGSQRDVTEDPLIADPPLRADLDDHLVAPPDASLDETRRRRFIWILAACVIAHALVLAILFYESNSPQKMAQVEEIPVELVPQMPEEKVEPPPPPPPPPPKQKEQPKPKQKVVDDEQPAYDAPREANKETIEREAPEKETQAQRVAPPSTQTAETPAPPKPAEAPPNAIVQAPEEEAPAKLADDNPNAEPLDKAEPAPQKKPTEKKAPVISKAPSTRSKNLSVSDQLAALSSVPEYHLGSAAKPSPIGGGTAKTTYLSILFGLIMRQMHVPSDLRNGHQQVEGIVAFYVDENGNLTHQAVYRASGRPDLDAAALNAVRRAAPFPAPPRGDPHAIWFHYDTR